LGILGLSAAAAACGVNAADAGVGGAGGGNFGSATGSGGGTGTGGGTPPPEKEVESTYGAPVATGKYVWIANPASGRVAYIDASTLSIKLVDAGNAPTFVAAVPAPSGDTAIVLNVLSKDATLLHAEADASVTARSFPVPSSGNAWSVSKDGKWAVAWTDARRLTKPDPVEGYQDLTVLDLETGAESSTALSVGYRPVAVAFDDADAHAYAVNQDGITIISLGASPAVVKNVPLSSTPIDPGNTTDVSITPDGAYALVRKDGVAGVDVFDLAVGTRTSVTLPADVTDLDLSADGKTAVAVMRSSSQAALLPVPGIVTAPSTFTTLTFDTTVGSASLASASPVGFFYTNATPSPVMAVVDTSAATPTPRDILLRAPVLGVFPTPDAAHAVVLHDALTDQGSHYPAAVSLAPIAAQLPPKIVGIDAPIVSLAIAPEGDHVLVAAGDSQSKVYELVIADLPSLQVKKLALASRPIAAGVVAGAHRGYVAQNHPDGRITFVDFTSGQVRTLTGFELATQVTDGTP
jgi:hypothetical protein